MNTTDEKMNSFVNNEIARIEKQLLPKSELNLQKNIQTVSSELFTLKSNIEVYAKTISNSDELKLKLIQKGQEILDTYDFKLST